MEVVAAAFGVADVAARSAHLVWRLCESWRDAPYEIFQLRDDLGRAHDFYSSLKNDVAKYSTAAALEPLTAKLPEGSSIRSSDGLAGDLTSSPHLARLGTLLELVMAGGKVVEELESVIGLVLAGRLDHQRGDSSQSRIPSTQQGLGSRRKMVWLMRASRVKKLRADMTKNMLMVSGVLVALNTSTTSRLVESVAALSHHTDSHHQDLKHTMLHITGALTSMINASSVENELGFKELERRLEQLRLTSKTSKDGHQSSIPSLKLPPRGTDMELCRGQDARRKTLGAAIPSELPAGAAFLFCDSTCTCRCHSFRTRTSWTLNRLEKTLGYLSISAVRLRMPNATCDRPACTQFGKSAWYMVTYRVPLWLSCTTVRLYCSFSSPRGFDFNLRVCRRFGSEAQFTDTTIYFYLRNKDLEGVKRILARESCAAMDQMGAWEQTPLHVAVCCDFADAVLLLLRAGADPFYNNAEGLSPFDGLFRRWLSGKKSGCGLMKSDLIQPYYFEYLDRRGFSDLEQVIIGTKPMDVSAALGVPELVAQAYSTSSWLHPLRLSVIKGDVEWVSRLLRMGVDPNERPSQEGDPVLMDATFFGHLGVTKALVEAGADVKGTSPDDGSTALHSAVFDSDGSKKDALALVRLLLAYGAEVDAIDDDDCTPLNSITKMTEPEVARCLIQHGADINHESSDRGNPLTEAIEFESVQMLEMLLEEGADWKYVLQDRRDILHVLAASGTAETIRVCREMKVRGLDVSRRDATHSTPSDLLQSRNDLTDEIRDEFMALLDEQSLEPLLEEECVSDCEEFHDAEENWT